VVVLPQCWWRQYLARQVYGLRKAENDYINNMLNQKRWGQVGMVVVPQKMVRQYLRCVVPCVLLAKWLGPVRTLIDVAYGNSLTHTTHTD